jgi:quercetin dioxygenase-like cupin family protein
MEAFEIEQVISQLGQSGKAYLEFLRVPALSVGLYTLAAGGEDRQQPHTEDEVYYVVRGQGAFRAGEESRLVKPGSILYVKAGQVHRFHDITSDMFILVFFAPAEYSNK